MAKKKDEEELDEDELDDEELDEEEEELDDEDDEDLDDDDDLDDEPMRHQEPSSGTGKLYGAIALVGIALLVIGLVLGMTLTPADVDTSDLEKKIDGLQTDVASLGTDIAGLGSDINDIETDISAKDKIITNQTAQIGDKNAEITDLNAAITENQKDISKLQGYLQENVTQLLDVQGNQDMLLQNISDLNDEIKSLQENITSKQQEIDALETVITDLEKQLEDAINNRTKAANETRVMTIHLSSELLNFTCDDCHYTDANGVLIVEDPQDVFNYDDLDDGTNDGLTFRKIIKNEECAECHSDFPTAGIMDDTYKNQDCWQASPCHADWKTRHDNSADGHVINEAILERSSDCLLCHGDQDWYARVPGG